MWKFWLKGVLVGRKVLAQAYTKMGGSSASTNYGVKLNLFYSGVTDLFKEMNSIFGMFMEGLHVNFARDPKYS